jgi:hypothetical protein
MLTLRVDLATKAQRSKEAGIRRPKKCKNQISKWKITN